MTVANAPSGDRRAFVKDVGIDLLIAVIFVTFDLIHSNVFSPMLGVSVLSRTGLKFLGKFMIRFAVGYFAGYTVARVVTRQKAAL